MIEFMFYSELGDYKTINGETYLNPWIDYTVPNPVQVQKLFLLKTFSSVLLLLLFK